MPLAPTLLLAYFVLRYNFMQLMLERTLVYGGIVAGRAGVLVVEAFGSDAGARWMAEQARALTGRTATHAP